jgi:ABC-type lipoprotein release transport system permease subunit
MRSRRHDLAVLQALGFRPRQVRTSVCVQSVGVAVAALAIGVPLGVVAGRLSWQAFARQLGVVPTATTGWGTVAIVVVVTVLMALVVAQLPAHRAAATAPAGGLRTE